MAINLLQLDKSYVDSVGNMLSDAFMDNPLMLYFFPDDLIRKRILPNIYKSVVDIMMTIGTVYATSKNLEGVIGIIDSNTNKFITLKLIKSIIKALFTNLPIFKYISIIDIIKKSKNISMDNYPSIIEKCFQIEMVAVDRRYRGQGYMSKLIREVLEYANNNQSFCILQTETEENAMKYEHLGFKLYDKIESIPNKLYHYVLIYSPYNDICFE